MGRRATLEVFFLLGASGWWLRRGLVQLGAARAAVGGVGRDVEADDLQAMVALAVRAHVGEHAVVAVDVAVRARGLGVVEDHLARGRIARREDVQVELVIAVAGAIRLFPGPHLDLDSAADLAVDRLEAVAQVDVDALDVGVQERRIAGLLLLEVDVLRADGRRDVDDRVDTLAHAAVGGVAVEGRQRGDEAFHDRVDAECHWKLLQKDVTSRPRWCIAFRLCTRFGFHPDKDSTTSFMTKIRQQRLGHIS